MLSREENSLIQIQALNYFVNSLAGIFLQIYIFRLTGFVGIVLFNLSSYAFLLIFYSISGFLLHKYSTNLLIRSGIIITILSYLTLVLLKTNAVYYLIPLGAVLGTGWGLYWSGFNLSQYVLTQSGSRNHYFGKGLSLSNVAFAVGPILGGLIVTFINSFTHQLYTGYYALFFIVVLVNLPLLLMTKDLPSHVGIKFSFRQYFKEKRITKWKIVLSQNFISGLWDVAFNTLSAVLLFLIIKNDAGVGSIRASILLFSAVVSFFAGKVLSRFKSFYIVGAIGTALGLIIFAVWQNWTGILLLGLLYGAFIPFLNVPLSSAILNTIDENKDAWQEKYYMFLDRDGILGIARVLSYVILYFLFLFFDKTIVAKDWFIAVSIFPLLLGVLLYKMYKNV